MRIVRRLLALALFAAFFWVAWQFTHRNPTPVSVDLLVWQTPPVRLWAALGLAFAAGGVAAAAVLATELTRKGLVARRYRRAVRDLESEIHQLRNLPLAAEEGAAARPEEAGAAWSGTAGRDT